MRKYHAYVDNAMGNNFNAHVSLMDTYNDIATMEFSSLFFSMLRIKNSSDHYICTIVFHTDTHKALKRIQNLTIDNGKNVQTQYQFN